MGFSVSGAYGGGAQDALLKILVERRLRDELEQRAALTRETLQQRDSEHQGLMAQRQAEQLSDIDLRTKQMEQQAGQFDATRRERNNDRGLDQMNLDKKVMDEDRDRAARDASIEQLPAHLQGSRGLIQSGVMRVGPDDLEDPGVREQRELRRIGAMKTPMAKAEPSYQRIETVDGSGNPVIKFLTAEEVRQSGGVPGVPRTVAKAQAPDTVGAVLKQIDLLSQRINTGGMGPQTTVMGLMRRGAAGANMDNDVAEYESLVKGFIPVVARAVGHVGVLTQQDVDSVRELFPKPGDNQQLAQNKLNRVREILSVIQPQASHEPSAAPDAAAPAGAMTPYQMYLERKKGGK
jgi:hypothetical protein